jgi:hypothetical protein
MRRLVGQSDAVHTGGLALDRDLQLAMGGTEGELDVACDHWPLAVAAELIEPWRAREGAAFRNGGELAQANVIQVIFCL